MKNILSHLILRSRLTGDPHPHLGYMCSHLIRWLQENMQPLQAVMCSVGVLRSAYLESNYWRDSLKNVGVDYAAESEEQRIENK